MAFDHELFKPGFSKRFGKGSLIDLKKKPRPGEPGTYVTTPAETLNVILEIGGIKKGSIVEIFGPESSGKTTLALEILKCVQVETDLPVLVIDAEHAFNVSYAESIGLNLDAEHLYFNQEGQTENALNMIMDAARAGIGAVLLDSLPALTPKSQLEDADVTDARVAGNSKLLSDALKRIKAVAEVTGTIVILINQIRYKVGKDAMFGNPETRPGGQALKYNDDICIRTSVTPTPEHLADKQGSPRGMRVKAYTQKNKQGAPLKTCYYDVIYGKGIDRIGSIVDAAIDAGVIEQKGSWFSFHGEQLAQGKAATRILLEETPDKLEEIRKALWVKNEL